MFQIISVGASYWPLVLAFRFLARGLAYAGIATILWIVSRNLYTDFKLSELSFSEWRDKKASVDNLVTFSLTVILTGFILVCFIAGGVLNSFQGFYYVNSSLMAVSISKSAVTILIALFPGRILHAAATKLRIDLDNKISVVRYIRCSTSLYSVGKLGPYLCCALVTSCGRRSA